MATTRTIYVDTDSAGGDGTTPNLSGATAAYASLQAALDAEAADITAATGSDEILRFECKASAGAADDATNITQAGWLTSATNYIVITVQTGEEHGGVWDDAKYRIISTSPGRCINFNVSGAAHGRVIGLQLSQSSSTGPMSCIDIATAYTGGGDFYVDSCLCRLDWDDAVDDLGGAVLDFKDGNPTYRVWNTIVYVASTSTQNSLTAAAGIEIVGPSFCYNNTVAGFGTGYSLGTSGVAKNCIGDGNGTDFGTVSSSSDFNASSDTSASTGANSRTSQTFTFRGTDDYRLDSADAGAKDFGTDLSADGDLAFSDDIAGTTRPEGSAWDIGAFEVVDTGLAAPTNLTATVQSESQIDLSWDSVTGATGYDIERDSVVIVEDHQSTSYSDTGLTSLQEYSYRVRSRKVS